MDRAAGKTAAQCAYQLQRFERLFETNGDPRRDIAIAVGRHFHLQFVVRIPGMIAAQIGGLAACAPGESCQA